MEPIEFPEDHGDEQGQEHDEGPDRRVEAVEGVDDERQAEDDDRGAADRADETADLGERPRAEAEGRPDDEQHDGREVDRVHVPIVAQVGRT